jgi:hypothetical protein
VLILVKRVRLACRSQGNLNRQKIEDVCERVIRERNCIRSTWMETATRDVSHSGDSGRIGAERGGDLGHTSFLRKSRRITMRTKQKYNEYIQSLEWQAKRQQYFSADDMPQGCQGCGRSTGLHLHHHTYERMGYERLDDLVPVCADCHAAIHHEFDMLHNNLTTRTRVVLDELRRTNHLPPLLWAKTLSKSQRKKQNRRLRESALKRWDEANPRCVGRRDPNDLVFAALRQGRTRETDAATRRRNGL